MAPSSPNSPSEKSQYEALELGMVQEPAPPTFCGVQLKYISLVTLAVQNALLAIIMRYSRVTTSPSKTYSAAAAVLMNEVLKGSISLAIAFARVEVAPNSGSILNPRHFLSRCRRLGKEVFSSDCWKLSIPAILYVVQNNLQYVAASNLEAATFQVTYQMKILTTAFFSVILLRKRLSGGKWFALFLLAVGVAVVQIQSGSKKVTTQDHNLQPLKGFVAVAAACFTSGLAGVYFEMVLKNSPGDLWVRNVQLSLFSLLPALGPIIAAGDLRGGSFNLDLFRNFGPWAWATVAIQVFGGLVTALVIKYSDNILKGFATSLSIIISSLASVALFNFHLTFSFLIGSSVVLIATMLYAQPEGSSWSTGGKWRFGPCRSRPNLSRAVSAVSSSTRRSVSACSSAHSSAPGTPVEEFLPMFELESEDKKASVSRNLMAAAAVLGAGARSTFGLTGEESQPNGASGFLSRTHSQLPSRSHTPAPGLRSSPSMPFLAGARQSPS